MLDLAALAALVPGSLIAIRDRGEAGDRLYWLVIGIAFLGAVATTAAHLRDAWNPGLSAALWISIAATLLIFALLSLALPASRRLASLVFPYLLFLAVLATVWGQVPSSGDPPGVLDTWLVVHIASSVVTYALATLAAVAGVAVFVQERALKTKRPSGLSLRLPAVAESERLEVTLLAWAVLILSVGLATGMALQYLKAGQLLAIDHKIVFSLAAFAVLAALLALRHLTGLRGRLAARLVLLAYLCLTLAYPGVKFVSDVLIG